MENSCSNSSDPVDSIASGMTMSRCLCGCAYPCTCDLMKNDLMDIIAEMDRQGAVPENFGENFGLNTMPLKAETSSMNSEKASVNFADLPNVLPAEGEHQVTEQCSNESLPANYDTMSKVEKKRYKNNIASRVSRARRRTDHSKLLEENCNLRKEINLLKAETQYLRSIISVGRAAPIANLEFLRFDSCQCCSGQGKQTNSSGIDNVKHTRPPISVSCCSSTQSTFQQPQILPQMPLQTVKPHVQSVTSCCSSTPLSDSQLHQQNVQVETTSSSMQPTPVRIPSPATPQTPYTLSSPNACLFPTHNQQLPSPLPMTVQSQQHIQMTPSDMTLPRMPLHNQSVDRDLSYIPQFANHHPHSVLPTSLPTRPNLSHTISPTGILNVGSMGSVSAYEPRLPQPSYPIQTQPPTSHLGSNSY